MKVKYTYVPPCPRCGSVHTGRYIFQSVSFTSIADAERKALERGELVRIAGVPLSEMDVNLFCNDCGIEWMGKTTELRLDKEEIEQIKKRERITEEDFARFQRKHTKGLFGSLFDDLKEFIQERKKND